MARHALVIGASLEPQAAGPTWEERDALRMQAMLEGRGFAVELLTRTAATRDGIVDGYGRLIERVKGHDDAAVVYFAGHGGMATDADRARHVSKAERFIAPADYERSSDGDFRGISAWELSLLLERLTDKTHNVTVMLDCCHAGQMSRRAAAEGVVPRVRPKAARMDLARHYMLASSRLEERLGPPPRALRGPGVMGSPLAVRFAACGDWQSAYVTLDEHGQPTGVFTHELLATLAEVGDAPVSWSAVAPVVQARVLRRFDMQLPIIEGPARRILFSTAVGDTEAIPAAGRGDVLALRAGRITGVSEGDVYSVTAVGATSAGAATEIARVRVEDGQALQALHACARVVWWAPGHHELPAEALAWPIERALARHPVRVVASAGAESIEAAVAVHPRLRVAGAGETPIGELHVSGGELQVIAGDGTRLEPAAPWDLSGALGCLATLAAAQTLRALDGEHGLEATDVEIEWGTIARGQRIPRSPHGAALGLGDRIYLRFCNQASRVRVAHVFNIGLLGKITLVSKAMPYGIRMLPGEERFLGLPVDPEDPTDGIPLCWPDDRPRTEPGIDTLLVIVTTQPADLGALETANAGARGAALAGGSALQRLVSQLHEGGTRSMTVKPDPFFVACRSFVLHPLAAPVAVPGFAIDEDPLATHAAVHPEVWLGRAARAARQIEVRLQRFCTERAVRIDALVCTRSADRLGVFLAKTLRFAAGVHDGESLWSGPVQDLVDIYLWIAPDRDGRGLGELLAPVLASRADVQEALAALVCGAGESGSLAGGAGMALARAAAEVLCEAEPRTEGLLHTSFGAHEGYGVGRRAGGGYRAHGAAFGLAIADCEDAGG